MEVPGRMQGKSLLPMLKGEDETEYVHEQVFAEYYNAWTHGDAYGTMLAHGSGKDRGLSRNRSGGISMTWKKTRRNFSTSGTIRMLRAENTRC